MLRISGYYWVYLKIDSESPLPTWLIALYNADENRWYLHGVPESVIINDNFFVSIDENEIIKL